MKYLRIKYVIILSISSLIVSKTMALETPKYDLIKKEDGFEIREYQSMIIATTKVKSDYGNSTSTGFRRIANYIFGGNSAGMNIEMTAPVITNAPDSQNVYEIQFVMPSEHSMEDLPKPSIDNVIVKRVNLGKTAVLSFGGWATNDKASRYKNKLRDLLSSRGFKTNGKFMVAQYNSPWAIPPFRKNEIIVRID